MGSLSTALTRSRPVSPATGMSPTSIRDANDEQSLRAVRWATVWFSVLMIVVASTTSYIVIVHPERPHHPDRARDFRLHLRLASRRVSLRHAHATPRERYGQHYRHDRRLHRGRDPERAAEQHRANRVGISDPHQYPLYPQPTWLPVMEFPWWICFGTIVTFAVAMLFRTEREHHPPGQVQAS